ncbi:MAG: TonB-dependent receptor [Novosphingobium sp.]|uniref:TonB-dependent receptor plug domain-containing protein n=1 Tax=Novosphingobium sp. TaxID=1874826 RepID=UPI002735F390|nr:TonB-dependent receptor [Novosphingobium sp.]MDP3549996.1 TonB-dependent receptor [Novosphingobium sp.]
MSTVFRAVRTALLVTSSAFLAVSQAQAQESPADEQPVTDEIIVTGSRGAGGSAADSAAPVTLLSADSLARVGQPNLNQALTQLVPSFTAQTQGTDMSNFSLSARLRGLSPNHTLVMVNGKRRHGSAILQVISGPFQGSAAPSIDLIPPDAVQRIEILQEGAAAQYGSDAIAGVINIMLKSSDTGASVRAQAGQFYDGEGETYSVSGNLGYALGDNGFFNLTLFHRRNDYTFLGDGQIVVKDINGNVNTSVPAAFQTVYAGLDLANINGGQAKSALSVAFFNAGYDLGGVEVYAFGDIARRDGSAKQGYRPPNRVCTSSSNPASCFQNTGLTGFVPLQEVTQDEWSLTGGVRGEAGGWNWDLSAEYGSDRNDISTTESVNRSLYINTGQSPTSFYDGFFKLTQFVSTLDLKKEYDVGMAEPLTVAFGGEYRRETYEIGQGDNLSTYFEGGQSFPGFAASDAGKYDRNAKAVYLNFIAKPSDAFTVDLAGRYEDYSDFGDTLIGKITARYDFSPAFALRGTASTGFRAPTLAESNYSATNVAPTSATVQLPPNSTASAILGFGSLRPEKATNFSGGLVLRPVDKLVATIDAYYIKIKDRIAGTSTIRGIVNGTPQTNLVNGMTAFAAVNAAIAARGVTLDSAVNTIGVATFTNGIDTRTWGIDFQARYPVELGMGRLDLTLSANYNKTDVVENRIGTLFNTQAESFLETAQPKYKVLLDTTFTSGRFSATVRQSYQGKASILVNPAISGFGPYEGVVKATPLTDVELSYDLTDSLTFAIGANNLFDKTPEIPGLVPTTVAPGVSPYINGSGTVNSPYGHGTYGTNGGFYYARMALTF